MTSIAMRISSVFAIVLVAATGVASAEPERIGYGDSKPPKPDAARQEGGWTQLATPTPAKHGTEFVVLDKDLGKFGRLRVDADKGTVIVRRVKIYFKDGKQQVVDVDRSLNARRKSAEIDLKAPHEIDRIVVTTEPQTNGEYTIYGSSPVGVATR
jgi:hypothetical protein